MVEKIVDNLSVLMELDFSPVDMLCCLPNKYLWKQVNESKKITLLSSLLPPEFVFIFNF